MHSLRIAFRGLALVVGVEGVLLGLFLVLPHVGPWFEPVEPYRRIVAVAALALALALGWRFRRGRIIHGLVVLLAAAALPLLPAGSLAWLLGAALVPLDLALFGILPDRGIATRVGIAGLGLLGAQIVAVAVLAVVEPTAPIPAALPVSGAVAVAIAYGLGLLALVVRAAAGGGAPARGMLWASGATLAMQAAGPGGAFWLFAGGAAVLAAAAIEDAHALAFRDPLTGLQSRRALDEALERISGRYALAMVDIDHFKLINDRLGHETGDQVLRMVAKRLAATGGGAVAYRYGGEEFTLLFPGRTLVEARPWLEAVRKNVEQASFVLRDPRRSRKKPRGARGTAGPRKRLKVTVSIGAADRASGARPHIVAKAADSALYRAKKRGRNRVVVV